MSLTRRGFLGVLAASIAAASAGLPTIAAPATALLAGRKRLSARHIYEFDIRHCSGLGWLHRIDVVVYDPMLRLNEQWSVDLISGSNVLTAREIEPALTLMNNKLAEYDCEIGDIRSYSEAEWAADKKAQAEWRKPTN